MKGDYNMETKTIILGNYVTALSSMVTSLNEVIRTMTNDNSDENTATLRTVNVILESVRAQTINIQNAVDTYNE